MTQSEKIEQYFELFKKECQKWIEILGMKDWNFYYELGNTSPGCVAEFATDKVSRGCTIWFSDEFENGYTKEYLDESIRRAAFHEIMELAMEDLKDLAFDKYNQNTVDEATHKVIRILENTLFTKY